LSEILSSELASEPSAIPEEKKFSDIRIVLFELAGKKYGVDVSQVQGVVDIMNITSIPKAPHYMEGVTNLRGEVLPVIDLRKKLGLQARDPDASFNMIIINTKNKAIGFTVDQVNVVMDIDADDISVVPGIANTGDNDAIFGVAKHEEYLILLVDLLQITGSIDQNILEMGGIY
jgi:purine-binding chemotaxis protein CheW